MWEVKVQRKILDDGGKSKSRRHNHRGKYWKRVVYSTRSWNLKEDGEYTKENIGLEWKNVRTELEWGIAEFIG